ncbi:Toxin-antitoxin system HicB family antitoxin [Candidatus Desulfarcum epimagneticum]|uniref:Toxin-antitoxin system HicB family antitoxin n=1 Tax=uncultured Desulfobacteraceae bacterium TaxID=218296 RepID=A0A484HI31_9BACT|nr:Toxin-antitoxin system HicB family antitoxin [uncultured Desulfobacteraceae bacterium]
MVDRFGSEAMNSMTYKGYLAKINFDERDGVFWGKALGIKDSVTFEGETVAQLAEDFHNAIDHYLDDCKKQGRLPEKPYSGRLTLRLSPGAHAKIAAAAVHEGKSLNKWVADTLAQATYSR